MKEFGGPAYFIDRGDINTDEIIPAKYLTEISKQALKPHLLEDLHLEGQKFDPHSPALQRARVLVTRSNFGCGSSREHAVWALEVNDINVRDRGEFCPDLPAEHVQLRHPGRNPGTGGPRPPFPPAGGLRN